MLVADDLACLPARHRVLAADGAVVNVDESLLAGATDMGEQLPTVAGRGFHLPVVCQVNVLSRLCRVRGDVRAKILDLAIQVCMHCELRGGGGGQQVLLDEFLILFGRLLIGLLHAGDGKTGQCCDAKPAASAQPGCAQRS